jgi:hypothetical protein
MNTQLLKFDDPSDNKNSNNNSSKKSNINATTDSLLFLSNAFKIDHPKHCGRCKACCNILVGMRGIGNVGVIVNGS